MSSFVRAGRIGLPALVLVAVLLGLTADSPPTSQERSQEAGAFISDSSAAVSVPVLLVPGWSDAEVDLGILQQRLIEAGWRDEGVEALEFDDPVGSNVDHALEVARAVAELRMRTGAERVDIVAHSMGGLAVRYYLLFQEGGAFARRVVFLGTPHRGTVAAHLAWGEGGSEMVPGSTFLNELNERGTVPTGIRVKTIRTRLDLRVLPMSSATLPGASDEEICCPTHTGLLYDPDTFDLIRQFLEGG